MRGNTQLRPRGHAIYTLDEIDEPGHSLRKSQVIERDTLQCVHCGHHWVIKPGSGNVRGFCMNCNGPICGPRCHGRCIPIERGLELMEQCVDPMKVDINTLPVSKGYSKIILPGRFMPERERKVICATD